MNNQHLHKLRVKNIGIDTYRENTIYMRADCHICQSEGFTALTRVMVNFSGRSIVATLNVVYSELIHHNEAGLSREAMKRLEVKDGDEINITHLDHIESLSKVRAKIYGKELNEISYHEIISDIVAGKYSNVELSAFVSSCADDNLSVNEIISLTKAMINTGQRINWGKDMVLDKHCAGGLPGNRTTPIVVSIVAAAGLMIPKTSSKAITSPAGTADMMEAITRVDLSVEEMKKVVKKENGCFVGGGSMQLGPADDILISVEKALDIDSQGQMIASVLSKKAAAGSTHVLIDIPVGKTAKVRSNEEALHLQYYFKAVAEAIGLNVTVVITDGRQPVGNGIGPALEAIGVLSVLRNETNCPKDLKERSLVLAGELLTMSGKFEQGKEKQVAKEILESGKALNKFMAICKAQGGFTEPEYGKYRFDVLSEKSGIIKEIDNRKLARIAKLAGAPKSSRAGVWYNAHINSKISTRDLLFSIYADAKGELEYAKDYLKSINDLIIIE
ncbi:MAG: thymidine phosphorylase family protein [Bacteroidetes bacterium]|nr:MAG: thymidine phosphorylase family protein [Bacteroidota bacterium]